MSRGGRGFWLEVYLDQRVGTRLEMSNSAGDKQLLPREFLFFLRNTP
jgi:hypothetical protein